MSAEWHQWLQGHGACLRLRDQRVYIGDGIKVSKEGRQRWFRTLPKHGYPTEQLVRLALQYQGHSHLARSRACLLLAKLLAAKRTTPKTPVLTV